MARPGRGGSGGGRSSSSRSGRGGSFHSHSSSRSSSRGFGGGSSSRRSQSSGSGNRGPSGGFGGPGHGPGYGPGHGPGHGPRPPRMPRPPRPPRPPRRTYYGGGRRGSGCSGIIVYAFVFIIFILAMLWQGIAGFFGSLFGGSSNKQYDSNVIDEDVVYEAAQNYYSENFSDENHALLYYVYLEESETDGAYLIIGDNAIKVFDDRMQDEFWTIYDEYYYSDVEESEWLAYTFEDMGNVIASERGSINNDKSFNKSCYEDNLNWIKSGGKSTVVNGMKAFYDKTGIQPFVVLIAYEDLPGVVISTGNNSTVLKTLIIGVVVIIVLVILFKWWKKAQQRKKEEAETTERMLNTPLETFGNTEDKALNDLIDKYDDK